MLLDGFPTNKFRMSMYFEELEALCLPRSFKLDQLNSL